MKTETIAAMMAVIGRAQSAAMLRGPSPSEKLCQGTAFEEKGNWYCQKVQRVTYQNIGKSGQYNEVVGMDQKTGACEFAPRQFSGPLAPFNEPVSTFNTFRNSSHNRH
jgi:hypothetical protein